MSLKSNVAYSTKDKIVVRGENLVEDIMGEKDFTDMIFLEITGSFPGPEEKRMLNALLVTLVEHGLTPSALSARLTYLGAPEALQGAVSAGLLGAGGRYLGTMEKTAVLLGEHLSERSEWTQPQLEREARTIVESHRQDGSILPGIGHPIHVEGDPRTDKLVEVAESTGFRGNHVELLLAVGRAAREAYGRYLPVNAAGMTGAVVNEMELQPHVGKGIALISRCAGLVGHLTEEIETPLAQEVWDTIEDRVDEEQGE